MDDQDGALGLRDEVDVAVPVRQEVAQKFSDPVFGDVPEGFERRHQDHRSDVRALLGDEARRTGANGAPKQNDVFVSDSEFLGQVVIHRQAVVQYPVGGLLALVQAIARVLRGYHSNLELVLDGIEHAASKPEILRVAVEEEQDFGVPPPADVSEDFKVLVNDC